MEQNQKTWELRERLKRMRELEQEKQTEEEAGRRQKG